MKNAAKVGLFGCIMLTVGAAAGYGVARLVDLVSSKKAAKDSMTLDFCECDCENCDCSSECVDANKAEVTEQAE
jgi:hypothetical protein